VKFPTPFQLLKERREMTVDNIIDGLNILKSYGKNIEVASEHDVFYAGFKDDWETVSAEDVLKLGFLGWWKDESNGEGFGIFV
jgi:hypothetical protein